MRTLEVNRLQGTVEQQQSSIKALSNFKLAQFKEKSSNFQNFTSSKWGNSLEYYIINFALHFKDVKIRKFKEFAQISGFKGCH